MIAFIFPGQGSQQVGMGRALAEAFVEARTAFEEADAAFGVLDGGGSLQQLCFEGPEAKLILTEHTQPAILAVSVAAARVLVSRGVQPSIVAGHSLGEYSAHVTAGTFDFADAVRTVRRRGRYMQEAVPSGHGAMAAVLGLGAEAVARACADASEGEVVSPANINGPDQVVIAGTARAVSRAGARARAMGARRVVPLAVSAPFHCALMKPAEERLAPELRALPACTPHVPVVANVDAAPRREVGAAIEALVRQVASPVLWDATMLHLASEGVTTYVEVGPGRVLSALAKKRHKDAAVFAFGAPDDLDPILTHVRSGR